MNKRYPFFNIRVLGFVAVAALSGLGNDAKAQLGLGFGGSPEELATLITGDGVQILNPQLVCADSAYGTFTTTDIANFQNSQGLLLSTGNIIDASGPNLSETTTTEWNTPGDLDINVIAQGNSFDACVFEFDVVPAGDTLRFDFTFASEEYEEYVGTVFNDAFGFFISGPGITGDPGLNGAENIALVPITGVPVGINTVNNGNPDIGFPAANPAFFFSNPLSFGAELEYDGWTVDLVAQRNVTPCDTFHLKLAIADVGDRQWDSSVFIEEIRSNDVRLTSITAGGIENMVEGCNEGSVIFTRDPITDEDLDVLYFIGGTAINGVDIPQIGPDPDPSVPKVITIPANQASATLNIIPLDDGLDEGEETLIFYIGNPSCPQTIQDSLIFTIQDSLNISVDPPLQFVCLGDSIVLEAQADGATFLWTPSTFLDSTNILSPTATPTSNITYTVSTFASDCISSTTVQVNVTEVFLSTSVTNVFCAGGATGAIDLIITGGESPFDFEWTGPDGFTSLDQNLSGLAPGTYTVLVTDRDGCTATTSATISELPAVTLVASSPEFIGGNNVSCAGADDAEATALPDGGTPPYTYLWDDPSAQTTQTAENLAAGSYTVTVTDANGCQAQANIDITEPEPVIGTLEERIDVLCLGESTGSITISASGGVAPYTFLWNSMPPQSGPSAGNLAAGLYVVTISDINGCVGTAEIEIEEPDAPLGASVAVTNPSCPGDIDGSALATVSGGTPPYTYTWSSDPAVDLPQIDDLPPGAYSLLVTDDNGCTITIPFNIQAPAPFDVVLLSQTDVACSGEATGAATIQVSGGTTPYTISWNTTPVTMGNTISAVTAGTYTATITDANGCETSFEVVISEPADILSVQALVEIDPSCSDAADGIIEAEAIGGTAPYSFTWNTVPPTTGPFLGALEGGSYTVVVEDANGCTTQDTYDLTAPAPIEVAVTDLQNVLCNGGGNGSATVLASGGSPPYTYTWNDPTNQTGPAANNLAAGDYTATITDANGCVASIDITITEPTAPLGGAVTSISGVICFGDDSGQATVQGTGGSGSYSYQWDDPAAQQTSTATGLAAGTYNVTITDNNGCAVPFVLEVIITGPTDAIVLDLVPSLLPGGFNVACADDSTATITLNITGGTAPYDVLWNLPGLDTSTDQNLSDLGPGVYAVTVTDANGCEATSSISLTAPPPITIIATTEDSECFGAPEGSITLQIFGGVPGYSVLWAGPNGFSSTDLVLTNIEGGIYNLTITDASGCVYVDVVTVAQPDDLVITIDSVSDFNGFNTSCSNSQDGFINITPSGGVPPYSYQWNAPNNPNFSNQQDVTNLPAGTIEVVITDDNGCVENAIIELTAPDPIEVGFDLSLFPNGFNVSCFGAADGSIEANVTGGTPGYTFTWIGDGGFGPVFINPIEDLPAGEYSVLVQDANGCSFASSVELSSPPLFAISLIAETINGNNVSCNGAFDGAINLIVNGGEAPVTISWTGPNGFASADEDIFGLEAGTYCVEVTDADNCVQSACVDLTQPDLLVANLTPGLYANGFNLTCSDADDGFIDVLVAGGTAPFSYSWTGPDNFTSSSENISALVEGLYCLEVTDASGCTEEACVTLTAPDPIDIVLLSDGDLLCESEADGSISSTVSGGSPGFDFLWNGPDGFTATTPDIDNLASGTYCLTVTDTNGCESTACITIDAPDNLDATITTSSFDGGVQVACNGDSNGSAIAAVSGGTAPFTFEWTGPNGFTASTSSISNVGAGTYCLLITDANDCTFNECVDITEPDALLASPMVTLPPCNTGGLALVELNISGGTAPYTFNWNSGQSTETALVPSGVYTIIVTDANDCTITEIVDVSVPEDLAIVLQSPIVAGGINVACPDEATGIINTSITGGTGMLAISWTGPDGFISSEEDLNTLFAGTYCIEVEDALGCIATECITLTTSEEVAVSFVVTNIGCTGNEDGSISVSATGGTPAYTFEWTGTDGFFGFGPVINQLPPGTYCVIASDANGCRSPETCVDITDAAEINVSLTSPEFNGFNIACFGESTGSIDAVISGGSTPYTFSWTGPNGYTSTDQNPVGLEAGTYCMIVTDANDCASVETCITLTEPEGIAIAAVITTYGPDLNMSCSDVCDGAISITLAGGATPITVLWSGPDGFSSTELDITGLCPGTYSVTTTDDNACEQTESYTLIAPEPIDIDLSSPVFGGGTEISCFGADNGLINTAVTGGTPEFTFSWTGPNGFVSTIQSPDELVAGTYTLVVTDDSGCTATSEITLTQPDEALTANAVAGVFPSGDNVGCLGGADGSIVTATIGGTPPYSFNWLGPDDFNAETADIDGLAAGEYTLVVEDANSCVFTVIVVLSEPETALEGDLIVLQEVDCPDASTGGLQVNPTGGTPGYGIEWTGPGGFISSSLIINNLAAGTYTYVLTDANGCTATETFELSNPLPINIAGGVSPSICAASNGSITIAITGGAQPYTVVWSDGSTGLSITDLEPGIYGVTVTDANGCEQTASFEVEEVNPLEIDIDVLDASCFGTNTGSLEASLVVGTPPVTYTWTGPNDFSASGASIFNLLAGSYEVTAIDLNGCLITQTAEVAQPDTMFIENVDVFLHPNGFNISTFGGDDGVITDQTIVGGTEPYDLFWTGPEDFAINGEAPLIDLIAGTYQLVVLDNNFCSDTIRFTLRQPIPLELPNGISPNGDGANDNLQVRGIEEFPQNKVLIYNRWGNLIYEESNYSNDNPWEGVNNGGEQIPEGTYFVIVEIPDRDNLRGYLELRR